jgi:uncharacterized protein YjbI with pentapeptide repeats
MSRDESVELLRAGPEGIAEWNTLQERHGGDTSLDGVDLSGCDLRGANLRNVSCVGTDFRGANLTGVDLSLTRGLAASQFSGACMTGATMPDGVNFEDHIEHVRSTVANSRKMLMSVLLACLYSALTVATTTDVGLLTNSTSSKLPILGADIRINTFYVITPILLAALYVYFHVYLQRLWSGVSGLRRVVTSGIGADEVVDLWLIGRPGTTAGGRLGGSFAVLRSFVSTALAWYLVPATLVLLWLRQLSRHDWIVAGVCIVIISVVVGVGISSYFACIAKLSPPSKTSRSWWSRGVVALLIAFGFLFIVTFGAIEGIAHRPDDKHNVQGRIDQARFVRLRQWVPRVLSSIGFEPFVDLEEAIVSKKPAEWDDKTLSHVLGASLDDRDLRRGNLRRVFLVSGRIRLAKLQRSDFYRADLRDADLWKSDARGANFRRANLAYAKFNHTVLDSADFSKAGCDSTNFGHASIRGANFKEAYLNKTTFFKADLSGTNFYKSKLINTKLTYVNLAGADFSKARFRAVQLHRANLDGADLTSATGLKQKELDKACVTCTTKLPKNLKRPSLSEKCVDTWKLEPRDEPCTD